MSEISNNCPTCGSKISPFSCPKCGLRSIKKLGFDITVKAQPRQRYQCRSCKKVFMIDAKIAKPEQPQDPTQSPIVPSQ